VITLLSPAKSLDYDSPLPTRKHSQPRLLDHAQQLIQVMRAKSPDEIAELMSISDDLADLNAQRYADFTVPFTPANARPALLAFTGDVYQGIDPWHRFGERDFTEAQKTVRILSGLYGVLRPLDLMQPYRLEMGTKLATDRGDTLYDFWGTTITDVLDADLADSPGPAAVINLASGEYARSVDLDRLDGRVISPRFLDQGPDGSYRMVSFFAKRARGEMAGWVVRNRIRTIKAISDFDEAGYRFDPERSTDDQPTFLRDR
jgi:cytoplasmic iron level regulating protein YaaA (DUF328/UPF0246 family)